MSAAMGKQKITLKSSPHLRRVRSAIDRHREEAIAAAEAVADLAEPAMREFESSDRLAEFLSAAGFRVSRPWKDMPTAFRATAGQGQPAIGVLAEYDALPECGPRPGQWGHGCGHNLLGAGSALAGVAAAEALGRAGAGGRIVVFGCPAEESLAGKVFMAARRAFSGLDAVLAWHPDGVTRADIAGGAAMDSVLFRFRGRTAHAAGGPEQGRSALDAAMLTDVAVNFLREHSAENTRMHSVITDGGRAPNVVPDRAEIWYYVRGKDRKQVNELRQRVRLCARAGALATETRMRMIVQTSNTERIPNQALGDLLDAILRRCGPPRFTPADVRAAAKVVPGKKYAAKVEPIRTEQGRGSSDEDNVSWFVPLGRMSVACVPKDTTGHHRQYAAAVRLPGAHRGMLKAAEVLAAAAVELALNRPLLRKARAELRRRRRGKKYDLPMPASARPPMYPRPVKQA